MPVTNYHTVNGRLIGETTAGVRTDYLTDALGSITATVNESAQIINTYRYKPFGERLAKTGSGADPRFQFTGDTGSVTTSRRYAENYNRRRSLDVKNGRWGSVDPIWPGEAAYRYAGAAPTAHIDPSGLQPCGPPPSQFPPRGGCKERNAWVYAYCNYCHRCPTAPRGCEATCNHYASDYYNWSHCKPRGTGLSLGNDWYPNPGMGNQITPRPRPQPGQTGRPGPVPPYPLPAAGDCSPGLGELAALSGAFSGPCYLLWCYKCLDSVMYSFMTIPDNALRHCVASCTAAKECGCLCAMAADLREEFSDNPLPDNTCDLVNNAIGRSLAASGADCLSACAQLGAGYQLCEVTIR